MKVFGICMVTLFILASIALLIQTTGSHATTKMKAKSRVCQSPSKQELSLYYKKCLSRHQAVARVGQYPKKRIRHYCQRQMKKWKKTHTSCRTTSQSFEI